MELHYIIMALIAGACGPIQAGINSQLGYVSGGPSIAATISFIVGTLGLMAYVLVTGAVWPSLKILIDIPWWMLTGGFLGAILVLFSIILAPKLGATTTLGLIVAGQMITSLILDNFGLVGYQEHPINIWRVLGVALLLGGVVLVKEF
ncbi:MAG: DMT family transporter [Desulfomonilaceae bacterium]